MENNHVVIDLRGVKYGHFSACENSTGYGVRLSNNTEKHYVGASELPQNGDIETILGEIKFGKVSQIYALIRKLLQVAENMENAVKGG